MKKKLILFFMAFLFCTGTVMAQKWTITGIVIGKDDGKPIPGVTVMETESQTIALTDRSGKYSLNLLEGSKKSTRTLTFSYVGYLTQIKTIGTSSVIDVTLSSDSKNLSEVVVTALGISRKKNELPYAAQQVKGEELTRTRDNNFINGLSGKVAGLDIKQSNTMGGSTNVVIRGYKSLTGNNQALFVVDGIPISNANTNSYSQTVGNGIGYDYGNAATDVNPDDIASVNVLKGAAATALYGSRASNGVIMITTKKGRQNSFGITVNSGVTIGNIDRTTFPEYQKEYGAGYVNQYTFGGAYPSPDGNFWYNPVFGKGNSLITPFTEDASYGAAFDPNLMVYQWSAFDPSSPNYGKATPWTAAVNDPSSFYKTSISSSQSITMDGGSNATTFKIGYLRSDETGVLPNSKIVKNNFNFSGDHDIKPNLKVSASANYTKMEALGRYGTGYGSTNPNKEFRQFWQTNVDMLEQKEAYERDGKNVTWNWSDIKATKPIYADNQYWSRYKNFENDSRNRYFGNVALNWTPFSWVNMIARVSYDGSDAMQEERLAIGGQNVPGYSRYNKVVSETNYDLLFNFNHKLTKDISFNGLLGSNLRRNHLSSIFARTNGGLIVEDLYSLSNSANLINAPAEQYQRIAVDGLFANANFGYKELLFLEGSIRRDQSTTLPVENNSYWYPSVAGSFLFSNLMKESNWLSYGKFRLNYAEVGNDASALSLYDVYNINPVFNGNLLTSLPVSKNNPNLKPERTTSFETGMEVSFYDGRFGFDFSYYKSNSVDQIMAVNVSTTTGFGNKFVNAGTVRNQGVEISAFVLPVRNDNFSWTVNLNFARNRNKVISLYEDNSNLQLASFNGGVTLNATVGQPFGTLRGVDFVHLNGNKQVEANGYYSFSESNQIIGDVNPLWTGGIQNNFKYKSFNLSFLIDIKKGGQFFSIDQYYGQSSGLYKETAGLNDLGNPKRLPISEGGGIVLPGVDKDGKPNTVRVEAYDSGVTPYGNSNTPTAGFIYDGGFVKLREAAITWSMPAKWFGNKSVKGVDVSLIGRNLWIIHKNIPYADPEAGLSSGNLQGNQSGAYPSIRNVGFNFKFRF